MTHKGLRDCRNYYIYVVLSQTQTRVGGAIRKLARIRYNHAAIAFDSELKQLYSFARRQYKNPLDAGLVREHPEWYSLRRFDRVDVRIYKIPVTRQQYLKGKSRILEIRHDADGYLYNLFSVLFFPFMKGFETYKAYSCAEFVAHMLRTMNIELAGDKLACAYTPQEIGERMGSWLMYEGNLLDYCQPPPGRGFFFDKPGYGHTAKTSAAVVFALLYRKLRFKNGCTAVNIKIYHPVTAASPDVFLELLKAPSVIEAEGPIKKEYEVTINERNKSDSDPGLRVPDHRPVYRVRRVSDAGRRPV